MTTKTVRILRPDHVEGVSYKPNQLVDMDASLAKGLEKSGTADGSKASIKYCKDQGVEVIPHESIADAEAAQELLDADERDAAALVAAGFEEAAARVVELEAEAEIAQGRIDGLTDELEVSKARIVELEAPAAPPTNAAP